MAEIRIMLIGELSIPIEKLIMMSSGLGKVYLSSLFDFKTFVFIRTP